MANKAHGIKLLSISGGDLAGLGCNATLDRGGERESFHFPGPDAPQKLAAFCDRFGYRVVTISTPRTIYRDLQGTREQLSDRGRYSLLQNAQRTNQVDRPEAKYLSRIGRKDLLA